MLGFGRHQGRCWIALSALALGAGCGQTSIHGPCKSDGDCTTGERCDVSTARDQQPIYGPCPYSSCQSASDCASGLLCGDIPPGYAIQPGQFCGVKVCVPPCDPGDATTCATDKLCRDDGLCTYLQCDEPGGITCPEHWRCDPEAAKSEPPLLSDTTLPVTGTTVVDPPDPPGAIAHGCVRQRCTEAGGYECRSNYSCKQSEAANGTGCVPTPCEELGHCSDDEHYICVPTSTAPRPTTKDENGCVYRNCEEGVACTVEPSPWHFCDPSDPSADSIGCAVVSCTEGSPCPIQWVCDPAGNFPDRQGCVRDPALSSGGASGSSGTSGSSNGGSTAATGSGATSGSGPSSGGAAGGGANGGGTNGGGASTGGSTSTGGDANGGGASAGGSLATGGTSGTAASIDEPGEGRCVTR
jgi:hypothetical protein